LGKHEPRAAGRCDPARAQCRTGQDPGGVAAFLSDPKRPIELTKAAMMTTPHLGEGGPHPVIASAGRPR